MSTPRALIGRYSHLGDHLAACGAAGARHVTLAFATLEATILGRVLPATARHARWHRRWWRGGRRSAPHAWYGWQRVGWEVATVDPFAEVVTFVRIAGSPRPVQGDLVRLPGSIGHDATLPGEAVVGATGWEVRVRCAGCVACAVVVLTTDTRSIVYVEPGFLAALRGAGALTVHCLGCGRDTTAPEGCSPAPF